MIRARTVLLAFVVLIISPQTVFASPSTAPHLISFTISPDSVDAATDGTIVSITLVVDSPGGVWQSSDLVTFSDGYSNAFSTIIYATSSLRNAAASQKTFQGSISVPNGIPSGAYFVTANPLNSLNGDGTQGYATDILTAKSTSSVVGAENALLIRNHGDLNYNYSTFLGPAFKRDLGIIYADPKFNIEDLPIWKVGEVFDPTHYYEVEVPSLTLKIASDTPFVCSSDGRTLRLIRVGTCSFSVYTEKTLDYQYQVDHESVEVTEARTKPMYTVGSVPDQSSANLPFSLPISMVLGPLGYVAPVTKTPSVCSGVAGYVRVVSGGTCTLSYSSPATRDYLPSDEFLLTFQVARSAQTITFKMLPTALLGSSPLPLIATASSGLPIEFDSTTPSICSATENSLKLLTAGGCQVEARQAGTATIAPAVEARSIAIKPKPVARKGNDSNSATCKKNGKVLKRNGPRCPF